MLASAGGGAAATDSRFHLVGPVRPRALDGLAFYALLPFRVARELRSFRPDVVLAQGAQEAALTVLGRRLARVQTRVIADIHGDPAAPARLYGSPSRSALAPLADALAGYGLRRSDGVRTISAYTSRLVREAGVEPTAEFAAFMDLEPFTETEPAPLPTRPLALFVGVLERYKAVDVLADAWRRAAPRVPDATLHLVGRGTLHELPERLLADLPQQVRWTAALDDVRGRRALDEATVLVLPSRSEGLGRGRRRGVLPGPRRSSRAGSVVSPTSSTTDAPACSSRRATSTRSPTLSSACSPTAPSRSGSAPRRAARSSRWLATPEEYACRLRELVDAAWTRA